VVFLPKLEFPQHNPTRLFADNTKATQIAPNSVSHGHTKHIEVDYHSIWTLYSISSCGYSYQGCSSSAQIDVSC